MSKTYRNKKKCDEELYNKFIQSLETPTRSRKKLEQSINHELWLAKEIEKIVDTSIYLEKALLIAIKHNLESEVTDTFIDLRLEGTTDFEAIDMALRENNIWWDT
jgi:hypothetical protein